MHISAVAHRATDQIVSSPWEARIDAENRRLQQNFTTLVAANPSLIDLGPDPFVDQLISSAGINYRQAFAIRLLIARPAGCMPTRVATCTAIVASSRLWHRFFDRSLLLEAKHQAEKEHVRCILVPQRALSGALRLSTGKVIAYSRHVDASASDRLRIISHLHDGGGYSDLATCAAQIRHADPAGVVLAMVASGDLTIDRSKPIGPHSRIDCNV